ncbi:hypothetical protein PV433_07585 [Paenibacillus sp. GYB004]|uniref:hypothetical protein n=1 Tax=Paenibacillus sp. GYB004 TaxID=2994393 RepID=UPI002F962461
MTHGPDRITEMLTIAGREGLRLNPSNIELNESGMDFIVAFATDTDGTDWVLRKPRRSDVWERAENERNVLNLVRELTIETLMRSSATVLLRKVI